MTYQIHLAVLGEKLDIGSSAVHSILESNLIPNIKQVTVWDKQVFAFDVHMRLSTRICSIAMNISLIFCLNLHLHPLLHSVTVLDSFKFPLSKTKRSYNNRYWCRMVVVYYQTHTLTPSLSLTAQQVTFHWIQTACWVHLTQHDALPWTAMKNAVIKTMLTVDNHIQLFEHQEQIN